MTPSDSWAKYITLFVKLEGITYCNENLAFFLKCLYIKPFIWMNLVSTLEKPRLMVMLPDSPLLLISFHLTSDACFRRNSCLFCLINLSATLTFLSFLLFVGHFFLTTLDGKWVISGRKFGPLNISHDQVMWWIINALCIRSSFKNGQSILIWATGHLC